MARLTVGPKAMPNAVGRVLIGLLPLWILLIRLEGPQPRLPVVGRDRDGSAQRGPRVSRGIAAGGSARLPFPRPPTYRGDDHARAGVDLLAVSRVLGHADVGTTASIYGHMTRAMQQTAADRMDDALAHSS
jgi:integrase